MITKKIVVLNPSGLHARPASNFVKITGAYKSKIDFVKDGKTYNGKSILSVMAACVKCKEEIELQIDGADEADALQAIEKGIQEGLGEEIHE